MSNFLTILRRELSSYFNSAIAYIFLMVFAVFANGFFMLQFFQTGKADMRPFFNSLPFVLNIFIPAITMRLWAEEKRTSTYELLLTLPMRPGQLVLGKFFASLAFYLIALVSTITLPLMIFWVGHPDMGPIFGGYIGALLMGALFLSAGIFISGLCKDQIVAFVLAAITSFALFFSGSDFFATMVDGWLPGVGTFIRYNFGMVSHSASFSKGVIDLKDILYFVVMAGIFLFLNGLSLEGRYRPKAKIVFGSAVGVCLVSAVLVNWLLHDLPMKRWDITVGQTYTISDASKRILHGLKAPVQVKFYVSPVDSMPTALKTLEREVSDKFEELKITSEGKLKYKVIHVDAGPEGDAELKNSLRSQGIIPFQIESVQKDEVGIKLIYSTAIIEYKEKPNESLPRIVPAVMPDLEYQTLSRILKMTLDEEPKVAIYAPAISEDVSPEMSKIIKAVAQANEKDYQDEFKTATQLIRNNGYEGVRFALTKDDPMPEKIKMLMLLNPGDLSDRQRFEINKYLAGGGTVVIAAQGFEYTFHRGEQGMESSPKKLNLDINKLLDQWGIKIDEDVLLDENSQVISLSSGQNVGPFALSIPVKFPNQIIVDMMTINPLASLTSRIPSLAYLWGSALDLKEDVFKKNGIKHTVLFTSSVKSWKMPNDGSTPLTADIMKPPADVKGKFPLAVLAEGQFPDLFDGNAPAWKQGEASEKIAVDLKPGKLLVVGCEKAFGEDLIQNPGNINFFANIVDGLTLGDDLVKIRAKSTMVSDIKRLSAAEKVWYRFWTVGLVPVLLGLLSGTRLFLRRKEKEFYSKAASR